MHAQLTQLSIDIATYSVVFVGLRSGTSSRGGRIRNPLLIEFVSRGFAVMAATAIRRQDDSFGLDAGRKSVHGLRPIIQSMRDDSTELTRASMLQAEGLPFEYQIEEVNFSRQIGSRLASGGSSHFTTSVPPWMTAKHRHQTIDRLAGTTMTARSPTDRVLDSLLKRALDDVTAACRRAKFVVDKYVAHSATKSSRDHDDIQDAVITLDDICSAHRTCCQVARFLAVDVLGKSCAGFMPVFAYDQLEHVELLLEDPPHARELHRAWDEFKRKLDSLGPWMDSSMNS